MATGWVRKATAATADLPSELPDPTKVAPEFDGETFEVGKRRFRFTYSHWTEIKERKPYTRKSAANGNSAETPATS